MSLSQLSAGALHGHGGMTAFPRDAPGAQQQGLLTRQSVLTARVTLP